VTVACEDVRQEWKRTKNIAAADTAENPPQAVKAKTTQAMKAKTMQAVSNAKPLCSLTMS